jgi:hypothetical protein
MTTISAELPDEFIQAIEDYIHNQPDAPTVPAVVQIALKAFLTAQGYVLTVPPKQLTITPASQGSGYANTAIDHDLVLA